MAKEEEIFGELNPGFSLWTSAHGFHHYRWKRYEKNIKPFHNHIHISYISDVYSSRHQIATWNLGSLSADQRWRRAWGLLLAVASLLLLTSFTYHSYQVNPYKANKKHQMVFQTFSSAVFSHVSLSKAEGPWPALTICERQGLSRSHIQRIVTLLNGWKTGIFCCWNY